MKLKINYEFYLWLLWFENILLLEWNLVKKFIFRFFQFVNLRTATIFYKSCNFIIVKKFIPIIGEIIENLFYINLSLSKKYFRWKKNLKYIFSFKLNFGFKILIILANKRFIFDANWKIWLTKKTFILTSLLKQIFDLVK